MMNLSVNEVSYSNDEHINGEMPPWGYTLAAVVLFFIGFFGFFLNLIALVLMCKDVKIWTPMNVILLNLICSDFSVSILGNPFTLASAINHGWIFGEKMCVIYGYFMSLLGISSITTLTVLSFERYCLITSPFSASHLTNGSAKFSLFLIWLYSFLITSLPLLGWGSYVSESANISCSVNWESQTLNARTYVVFLFVFGLFLPLIVIIFSYCKILKTLHKNALRSGGVNKMEKKVTVMIFVMIVAFLLAWTPYSIFALIEQFGDPELISNSFAVLPALIAKSSICYNPLIYCAMNSQFHAAWRRMFGREVVPTTTVNETTINQVSETSTSAYIECSSFSNMDKRKRNKNNKATLLTRDIKSLKAFHLSKSKLKQQSLLITNEKNETELQIFSNDVNIYGKAINQLITSKSFESNMC